MLRCSRKSFKGITTNGALVPGLFALRDERAPTKAILDAVATLFSRLTPEQMKAIKRPIHSKERHRWWNGIRRYETFGIWLDETNRRSKRPPWACCGRSLSATGYESRATS